MTNYYYLLWMLALWLILPGCATQQVPEVTTYALDVSAEAIARPAGKAVPRAIIKVAIPQSSAAIMSRQILYQDEHFTQNSYLYSRWSEVPNKMLAQLLLSYLAREHVYETVLPAYSKGREDFLLESSLAEFYHHINTDGSSTGRIKITFYLIDVKDGRVAAAKEFFSAINATSLDARGAVSALNAAAHEVASGVSQWLASEQLTAVTKT